MESYASYDVGGVEVKKTFDYSSILDEVRSILDPRNPQSRMTSDVG